MRKLLNGKMGVEKETEDGSLYFVFPRDVFHKYIGFLVH